MRSVFCFLLGSVVLFSCGKKAEDKLKSKPNVELVRVLEDSILNVRALQVINNTENVFFLDSKGYGGRVIDNTRYVPANRNGINVDYPLRLVKDTTKLNFRGVAQTSTAGFGLSIGSPAYLYKFGMRGAELVYQETHEKAFYDAIKFWNDKEGIAIGDPTEGCMSIIITRDGGDSWTKLSCDVLPAGVEGEAAFAASNTNIAIVGDKTWVATGGKTSRIFYSEDKGHTWEVFDTPIVQGQETTGIYSIDFYDELHGFAIGGDYTQPDNNQSNKMSTSNGGKTWELIGKGEDPGYRSCVQYLPNGKGKELVAVGFKGIDYSNDAGKSWTHLSDEGFYTIRFVNDSVAYAGGKGRVSKLIFHK